MIMQETLFEKKKVTKTNCAERNDRKIIDDLKLQFKTKMTRSTMAEA